MFNRFFKIIIDAIVTREKDPELSSHHAALIVSGGKVLSIGFNKIKRNGFITTYAHHEWCNTHAECDAILRVRKKINLRDSKIYVARVRRDGKLGNSKPCLMCTRVLGRYGIKKAY